MQVTSDHLLLHLPWKLRYLVCGFKFFLQLYVKFLYHFTFFFYISVSGWLKLAVLNIVVILIIIVFARLFIFHLYVTKVNIK